MSISRTLASIVHISIFTISVAFSQDTNRSAVPTAPVIQLHTLETVSGELYFLKMDPTDSGNVDSVIMVPPSDYYEIDPQPAPIKMVEPVYPYRKDGRFEATVWVKALMDTAGNIIKAEILKSENQILNSAAIEAALQWTFNPARIDGELVQTWVAIPFKFKFK